MKWTIYFRLKIIQHTNTIQKNENKKNYVAEMDISKDGKFIYCSNRVYCQWCIVNDKRVLSVVDCVSIYGKKPDNKWLIGANQDSNNLVVFKRNLIIIVYLLYIMH